jgi:hypothetical protein
MQQDLSWGRFCCPPLSRNHIRTLSLADEDLNVIVVWGQALRFCRGDIGVATDHAAELGLKGRQEAPEAIALPCHTKALWLVHLSSLIIAKGSELVVSKNVRAK